ncbi:Crp/Fnr family transcriptional regulator [Thermaerobacillus caldiproteolyticus]|uniref:Crp/Fnr family transcriptional regulator n=1 Tax=Thermaerobacillus caldiproteolyticus TaxID=247480 RepID=UPI00188BB79B|nr:Crp/Fnr family transcriptional regulator [Anoxybacillus caldiproteolyticus]QPA32309.1 Crp/Fnr family transcriptional regulator [Anoxybacillus caldiproteolyticus]
MLTVTVPSIRRNEIYKFPVFNALPRKRVQEIMEHAFIRNYHKNQILFMEGDPRDRIYLLLKGFIKQFSVNDVSSNELILYLKPYSIFPYIGIFQDKYYRFSAKAVTDVEIIYIPMCKFESMIQNDTAALINLIRTMGNEMHELEIRIQKLTQVHAVDRIKQLISFLMKDIGEKISASKIRIPCPITTTDLAKMAGTSRETVSHVLQKYKKSGKLIIESKIITITNPDYFMI